MAEQIAVTVEWTPKLYAAGARAFQAVQFKHQKWFFIGAIFATVFAVFFVLGPLIQDLMLEPGDDIRSFDNGVTGGVATVIAGIFACGIVLTLMNRRVVKQMTFDAPYFSRPWVITLSVQGIRNAGPFHASRIDWGAITGYKDVGWGVVLSLGPGGFIPLPNEGLPDGMDRSELLRHIETWQAAADF